MIQTLHFLSGATLLLINYLVVNFSVMRKCAINQKAAEERRRKGIKRRRRDQQTLLRQLGSQFVLLVWARWERSPKNGLIGLDDERRVGQTIALIDWSCLALRETENTLRLSATITRGGGCCQRANSSVIIPVLPVELG